MSKALFTYESVSKERERERERESESETDRQSEDKCKLLVEDNYTILNPYVVSTVARAVV